MVEYDIELKLNVPADRIRRFQLMEAARKIVGEVNALPPVSLQILESMGKEVLGLTNGDTDELAFAMLMCSNELWRPYFEATHFTRRLLLMPQCLKDSNSCKALIDDIGLICAACNNCSINSLLEVSENLGYETIVTEGSSAAIALVGEGAVDAILGVSCMEVLQKSFKHVVSSAIPSIAIPLLHNGCIDTEVDIKWLLSEINTYTPNTHLEPLSVSLMKVYIENLFSEIFLSNQFEREINSSITGNLAVKSILQGGKRMRPLLTLMTYTAYAENFDQNIADQLMIMVECFHKASIIHDDIEDQDDYRYNKKTIHHENGVPIAINLGDYLIGQGYLTLSTISIPADKKLLLLELFSKSHVEMTLGQGEELFAFEKQLVFDITKTLNIFRLKTGSAIRVSLLSGALAGNAPKEDLYILQKFSDLFGIAYQIRDDLTEFKGLAKDQHTASFPYLKSLLIEKHHVSPGILENWRDLIIRFEIEQIAQIDLDNKVKELSSSIEKLSSRKLHFALLNVVNRVFE